MKLKLNVLDNDFPAGVHSGRCEAQISNGHQIFDELLIAGVELQAHILLLRPRDKPAGSERVPKVALPKPNHGG